MLNGKIVGVLCLLLATSAVAAPNAVPKEQSKCEVESNSYWAIHFDDNRHTDPSKPFVFPPYFPIFSLQAPPPDPVKAFRDDQNQITFSVERDGRHIAATDQTGKLLWRRNPFVDFNMCPYRSPHPYIQWIGAPDGGNGPGWHVDSPATARPDAATNAQLVSMYRRIINSRWPVKPPIEGDRFVGVAFNSSQFGYINIRTGDYYDGGQN